MKETDRGAASSGEEPAREKVEAENAKSGSEGISLASSETKLETLPEVALLTEEILDERQESLNPPEGEKAPSADAPKPAPRKTAKKAHRARKAQNRKSAHAAQNAAKKASRPPMPDPDALLDEMIARHAGDEPSGDEPVVDDILEEAFACGAAEPSVAETEKEAAATDASDASDASGQDEALSSVLIENEEETADGSEEAREENDAAEEEAPVNDRLAALFDEPDDGEASPESSGGSDETDSGARSSGGFPVRKAVRWGLITAAVVVLGLFVFEIVKLMGIVGSVNYTRKKGDLFGQTEVVSRSVLEQYVSHSDEAKHILLIGYDVDENGVSRSDSMIILTLDHEHHKVKMTSLMRDMYLYIPGHGKHKLNAAFVYGGPELLQQTIYANFGMQIDNYVCVDYRAFIDAVDAIGGVPVELEEMELEQFNKYVSGGEKNRIYEAGSYVLNGAQTLSYCRIRKVGSDTARTARQREVLGKIVKKCSGMSVFRLEKLLRITAPAVTTNLSMSEIFGLAAEGLGSKDYQIQGLRIPVDGAWYDLTVDGISYVGVDIAANARYMQDFIYGDDETADRLVERQKQVDQENDDWERRRYERKKERQGQN